MRRSKRELETAVEGLEGGPEAAGIEFAVGSFVTRCGNGWMDATTGDPVAVDEDRDLIIDFEGTDT